MRLAGMPTLMSTGVLKGHTSPQYNGGGRSPVRFAWNDLYAVEDNRSNGVIVKLVFDILDDAKPGVYQVTITPSPANIANANLNTVPFEIKNGNITIAAGTPVTGVKLNKTYLSPIIGPEAYPENDIIPIQAELSTIIPIDIVVTEPIIFIPDPSDVLQEIDMLSALLPDINPTDMDINECGAITVNDSIAKGIAEKLLCIDNVEVLTLPVFEAVLNNPGETAAISFKVKGSHLMFDGLVSRAENVRLMALLSTDIGDWYTYVDTISGLSDKAFTILDMSNKIYTGELDLNGDYLLVFLIKDGGAFDLDKQIDGSVWGAPVLIGVSAAR